MDVLLQPLRYWAAGGALLIPIAAISLGIWVYFLRTRRVLKTAIRESHELEDTLSGLGQRESPASLRRRLASVPGLLAGYLRGVLRDVEGGVRVEPALEERKRRELARLRWDLVVLSAFTVAAPLLGLLGTVVGMIKTFQAVSASTGQTVSHVASGVSQALITTQFGLTVAIPGVFGLARLERLYEQLKVRFGQCRAYLLLSLARAAGAEGVAL